MSMTFTLERNDLLIFRYNRNYHMIHTKGKLISNFSRNINVIVILFNRNSNLKYRNILILTRCIASFIITISIIFSFHITRSINVRVFDVKISSKTIVWSDFDTKLILVRLVCNRHHRSNHKNMPLNKMLASSSLMP